MSDVTTSADKDHDPGDRAEQVRRVATAFLELRDAVRRPGPVPPVPPGPDRNRLFAAIQEFSAAVTETLFGKKPRRPRRAKLSFDDGWVGG